jgi:hypothetical protein
MLHGAEVAICSEINIKQINTVRAESQFFSDKPAGAHNQNALKC